ncbi:hypothetical protein RZE82_01100 [Mollicutes bacterium LVI A0039]|nr:hypothetical protein RZE82_01100 [Mollicutes bacterium LVI A0039]
MKDYSSHEIELTLNIINATIVNCEKVKPKLKAGSSQLSLTTNRIHALETVKLLIEEKTTYIDEEQLNLSIIQITSILNKSQTGLSNAKAGSGVATRFNKLVVAMNVCLDYLNEAVKRANQNQK